MQRLALVSAALLCSYSYSNAQVATTTPLCSTDGTTNPLNSATNGTCLDPIDNTIKLLGDQGDFGLGSHPTGDSHNQMYQTTNKMTGAVTSTDYILHFSYTPDTWLSNFAINQALIGAGFDISGYVAEWQWKNENTNTINGACNAQKVNGDCLDDLIINIDAYANGVNIYNEEWDYSQTKSNGYTLEEIVSFAPQALVPGVTIDEIEVTIYGVDNGYWQGMYGPKVRNFSGSVILQPDSCTLNGAISDPGCPGYANALFQQQCTANPLYDPSCPGYANANQTLICNQNPASDPSCPDYYIANCNLDSLYDPGCSGYADAYFEQQCSMDAQYSDQCIGFVDLSIDDDAVEIYDPIIENVLEQEYSEPIYAADIPTFEFEYVEENVQEETDTASYGDEFQVLEDDIEAEIAALEAEGENGDGELNLEDDIENEIAQLEESTQEVDAEDPRNGGRGKNMEDDIEAELAQLEKESNTEEGKSESTNDDELQVSDNSNRPDGVVKPSGKSDKRKVISNKNTSRRDKMRLLIAQKAIETTKELEEAVSFEQSLDVQRRLLALISYVPDFKNEYGKKEINQVNFYPPKPVVDHAYARWFLNDPTFGAMEDLQYNFN